MFISQLKNRINQYDPFGEHRTNGLKALLVLELLFIFNFFYTIYNPYFYYFYVPLTAFAAEVAGNSLREKFIFLLFALVGSGIAVFLFGILSPYSFLFLIFVFAFSLTMYSLALKRIRMMFVAVPVILSLGSYSLIYGSAGSNFYVGLNHLLQTLTATIITFTGLYLFPRRYYLKIWYRAFCNVLCMLENISGKICNAEIDSLPIFNGIIIMERYSKMLNRKMKYFSILKITLIAFDLIMAMSYMLSFQKQLRQQYMYVVHHQLQLLAKACKNKQPIALTEHHVLVLHETNVLRKIHNLIVSWNYLCHDL